MSQTNETTPETPAIDVMEEIARADRDRRETCLRNGPVYSPDGGAPGLFFDQFFEKEISPSGTITLKTPLRVGATRNGLDVILVASHRNAANLAIAASATITLTTLQGDRPDGTFEEVGPAICVTAPTGGISVEPDMLAARFAIGNFKKPWLKIKLVFAGAFAGGKLDCALGYAAR